MLSRSVPLETGSTTFALTRIMSVGKSSDTHQLSHLTTDLLNWESREKACSTPLEMPVIKQPLNTFGELR